MLLFQWGKNARSVYRVYKCRSKVPRQSKFTESSTMACLTIVL